MSLAIKNLDTEGIDALCIDRESDCNAMSLCGVCVCKCVYVAGICGNQAFPEMPRQFRKCLEFPQLPRHFWKCLGSCRNRKLVVFNLQHSKSGKRHTTKKT